MRALTPERGKGGLRYVWYMFHVFCVSLPPSYISAFALLPCVVFRGIVVVLSLRVRGNGAKTAGWVGVCFHTLRVCVCYEIAKGSAWDEMRVD